MKIELLKGIKTLEELKGAYKKLARKFHPDLGGSTEQMQRLNAEYEYLNKTLKNQFGYTETVEQGQEFIEMINELLSNLDSIEGSDHVRVDIVGTWIWIYGTQKGDTELIAYLKKFNFRWNGKKEVWRWCDSVQRNLKYRKNKSTEEIYQTYGSETIKEGKQTKKKTTRKKVA